jgi:hypothetical protein
MGKVEKLLQKARQSPQNLRYSELCLLLVHHGFKKCGGQGSHTGYKTEGPPAIKLTVQEVGGMAKPYQVRQFLGYLDLLNRDEEDDRQ